MTVRVNRPATHTEVITKDIEAHIDHQDRTKSRQQTPQQQSSTQQLNSNTPVISITLFTKNFNVLDVDSMDTIREDVL